MAAKYYQEAKGIVMSIQQKIKNIMKLPMHDQRGAVLPLIGLALGVILLASGFAIDYTRAQIVRERLQWAVDAGALAGAKAAPGGSLTKVKQEANAYFRANFPEGYMGTRGGSIQAQWVSTENGKGEGIRFSVNSMKMENYFADIVGVNDIAVSASAEVNTLPLTPLDVVFSIDMSGSMGWRDGTGAQCLGFYNDGSIGDLWLPGRAHYCTCGGGFGDYRCNAQGVGRLANAKKHIKTLRAKLDGPNNAFAVAPWDQRTHTSSGYRSGPNAANCSGDLDGLCNASLPQLLNFTKNKSTFDSYVGGNTTGIQGGSQTDHANGMYWARQLYKNRNTRYKTIVFISDGWPSANYERPGDMVSSGNDVAGQRATFEVMLKQCNEAKKSGIIVYTILYNLNAGVPAVAQAINYMRSCASQPDYFFSAGNAASLGSAMEKIGNDMMTMRLTR